MLCEKTKQKKIKFQRRNKEMNKKTVASILSIIGLSALLIGCDKPDFNAKINANVNVNNKPVLQFQNEAGNNSNIEAKANEIIENAPHFSSLKVYCGSEDITSKVDQERLEQLLYAVYSSDDFLYQSLDEMHGELDPANIPEGKIQIVAEYDPVVDVNSLDVDKVIIVYDQLHEDSYFFVAAGACTFAPDVTMNAIFEACGL